MDTTIKEKVIDIEEAKEIMTIKEAKAYLHIGETLLRSMIYDKEIPFFKMGYRYYFRKIDIDNWIASRIEGGHTNE